jgi:TPP-dependent pyruvate/acetoin dehydrogenase alpha subunit
MLKTLLPDRQQNPETGVFVTPDIQKRLLHDMKRLRAVEETIAARYNEQEMRCPVHLSVGQEGIAGLGPVLRRDDYAVSGHRAHAHYMTKGGDVRAMLAEIYGKVSGCARGKGGSMHLIDESAGFMGSTAIVAGTVPVGVGLALSIKRAGSDRISCIFIGDAVMETGAFYEATNFAILHKLPVLFVCENNLYSVYSPLRVRQPAGRKIHELAAALGMPAWHIDGNDVEAVYAQADACVRQIRSGLGPQFMELSTYRWREHCGPNYDNDIGYRTEEEFQQWKAKEPIGRHEKKLLAGDIITQADISAMDMAIEKEIQAAFAYAQAAPFPEALDAYTDLYAP